MLWLVCCFTSMGCSSAYRAILSCTFAADAPAHPDEKGFIDIPLPRGATGIAVSSPGWSEKVPIPPKPTQPAFAEVQRSNMSKLGEDGKPIRRESDGKVMKGPNYSAPDLAQFLPQSNKAA